MHDQRSVMQLVIDRLYFGSRPSPSLMQMNGSILKRLNRKHSWDDLAQVVEGLALRRDRGELTGVPPKAPVSLKWVIDKDQRLNQVPVCQDAVYRQPASAAPRQTGHAALLRDLLSAYTPEEG